MVARVLAEHSIDPAPERSKGMWWSAFLHIHWDGLAATNFFMVEVLTLFGLTWYHVLFMMELETRVMHIAGIVQEAGESRGMQIGRNLLDAMDGFLLPKTHLILDRAPVFTAQFCRLLGNGGVKPVRLPPSSPNLNPYTERFMGSIRCECLNKLVLLGKQHLRHVVAKYAAHYLTERNHQGLGNTLIRADPAAANDKKNSQGRCRRRVESCAQEVLGGSLRQGSCGTQSAGADWAHLQARRGVLQEPTRHDQAAA
jgi:hypothetical protein